MTETPHLTVDGEVAQTVRLTAQDLAAVDTADQIPDVTALGAKRPGAAVRLDAVLRRAEVQSTAQYLTIHASHDDFHASVPLAAIRDQAVVIYAGPDGPLSQAAGGPFRIWIPDTAACQTDEVDECASVKFVDRLELSRQRGFDNRPQDEDEHAELHRREGQGS